MSAIDIPCPSCGEPAGNLCGGPTECQDRKDLADGVTPASQRLARITELEAALIEALDIAVKWFDDYDGPDGARIAALRQIASGR